MTRAQAVRALDEMDLTDPEGAHVRADEILLKVVGTEVAEAYNALAERCAWWAYA